MWRFGKAEAIAPCDVLVVCTGNHTRSPYVAWDLQRRTRDHLVVSSAGTAAVSARSGADRALIDLIRDEGLDPSPILEHQPRQLRSEMVRSAGLVLTATREHRGLVDTLAPGTSGRVYTLLELAKLIEISPPPAGLTTSDLADHFAPVRTPRMFAEPETDLSDPSGKALEAYRTMIAAVAQALDLIVPVLLDGRTVDPGGRA